MSLTPKCPACQRALGHERGCRFATGPDALRTEAPVFFSVTGPMSFEDLNRLFAARVLFYMNGNVSAAARIVGIDRRTFYRKYVSEIRAAKEGAGK